MGVGAKKLQNLVRFRTALVFGAILDSFRLITNISGVD